MESWRSDCHWIRVSSHLASAASMHAHSFLSKSAKLVPGWHLGGAGWDVKKKTSGTKLVRFTFLKQAAHLNFWKSKDAPLHGKQDIYMFWTSESTIHDSGWRHMAVYKFCNKVVSNQSV